MATILCYSRCRSRDFNLLTLIRRVCAFLIVRNCSCSFRWVPSELNASDEGSRKFDVNYDASKDLT